MRWIIPAVALLLLAGPAVAQVGGNGVVKNASGGGSGGGVLGFNQTQTPRGITPPSVCLGSPLSTNGQVRQYIIIYSASGQPFAVPGC